MNRDWHKANPMPPRATFDQQVAWHREHMEACGGRQPPAKVAEAIEAARRPGDTA